MRRLTPSLLALLAACATAPQRAAAPAPAAAAKPAPKAAPAPAPAPAPARPAAATPGRGPATTLLEALAASAPPAVKNALARESGALPVQPFRTEAGIAGAVPARKAPAVTAGEGFESFAADIGAGQPMACFVYPQRVDAASSFLALMSSVVESSKIEVLAAELTDISSVKGSPLLVFHVGYTTKQNGQSAAGLLKIAILPHDLHSLTCLHDEMGYVATFKRTVAAVAGSLRRPAEKNPRDAARFAELHVARIQGRPAGFQEQYVSTGKGGQRTVVNVSTQIFNRSPKDLLGSDSYDVTGVAADGTLLTRTSVEVEDGEISEQLELAREGTTLAYAYSGTMAGKKLEGRFEAARPIATDVLLARRLARTAKNVPPAEARLLEWIPAVDPRKPVEVTYRTDAKRPGAVAAELGTIKIDGRVDVHGWLERSEMDLGPFTLVQERVWSKGTP